MGYYSDLLLKDLEDSIGSPDRFGFNPYEKDMDDLVNSALNTITERQKKQKKLKEEERIRKEQEEAAALAAAIENKSWYTKLDESLGGMLPFGAKETLATRLTRSCWHMTHQTRRLPGRRKYRKNLAIRQAYCKTWDLHRRKVRLLVSATSIRSCNGRHLARCL
jgi:hypothetical protein